MSIFDDLDAETIHEDHEVYRRSITKYAFGWCGSKSQDLDHILPYLPYYNGWVDVFGGSGIVTLARAKSKFEVYNDSFSGVTDFYRCIRDKTLSKKLEDTLQLYLHSREEWYRCHETWKDTQDIIERAAKWYYMNFYSHSYVGRTFGRQTEKQMRNHLTKLEGFPTIHERFKNVLIENMDFRTIFRDYAHHDTVMYCDPPYLDTDKTTYWGTWFTEADHKELLQLIFNCNSFVALSGHDNPLYNLYPWDNKISWKHFSIHTQNGQERTENLWIKEAK